MIKTLRNIFLLLLSWGTCFVAMAQRTECRHGLAWTLSQSKAWGLGRPVITKVEPYSAAEHCGLQVGDIIEVLDGHRTDRLLPEQIQALLQSKNRVHTLEVHRLGRGVVKHILGYACKSTTSLTERELAELFSLYSLEDANVEPIVYPYKYSQSEHHSLMTLKDFAIAPIQAETAATDQVINKELAEVLASKGLYNNPNADLVFSSYYQLMPLGGVEENKPNGLGLTWRYDRVSRGLKPFPLYPYGAEGTRHAQYSLTFGLQVHSRRTKELVWLCEAKEYLSEGMSVADYARSAIETMLTGFPFVKQALTPTIQIRTLRYHYTGIVYSASQLNRVVDVEDKSPAMRAGLRAGDIIRSINGYKLMSNHTDSFLEHYFDTASRLERYRDNQLPSLKPLVGNIPLTYWRVDSYEHIAGTLGRERSDAAFSYLFAFRPYIPKSGSKNIIFEIERGGQVYFVPITLEYRDESTLSVQ